jgi:uncharacterized membrane protein
MKKINSLIFVALLFVSACDTKVTTNPNPSPSASATPAKVDYVQVKAVITQKCAFCHSATPKDPAFTTAPGGGTMFDTDEQIKAKADRIYQRAVVEKSMPFQNKTNMTQEERDLLGKWHDAGSPTN